MPALDVSHDVDVGLGADGVAEAHDLLASLSCFEDAKFGEEGVEVGGVEGVVADSSREGRASSWWSGRSRGWCRAGGRGG